jgi:hypothetical protein
MNLRASRLAVILTVALLSCAGSAYAHRDAADFHWSGKLAPDQIVEIKDVNGTIEAQGDASAQEVEVTAEISGPHAADIKIQVVTHSDGVTICAIYPSGIFGGGTGPCEPGSSWRSRNTDIHGDATKVHFTVHMPKNLRFSGQNINGSVTAQGMGRRVSAASVNGPVNVSTTSYAEATTVNGSVHVTMGSSDWTGGLKFGTVNGAIELRLPDDLSTDVDIKSLNGHIDTDFPLTISGGFVGHSAHGRIGAGGRSLSVETVNGGIDLKKSGGEI